MIRTMAALVALLGMSAVAPVGFGSVGLGLALGVVLLGLLTLLFGICLALGHLRTRPASVAPVARRVAARPAAVAREAVPARRGLAA